MTECRVGVGIGGGGKECQGEGVDRVSGGMGVTSNQAKRTVDTRATVCRVYAALHYRCSIQRVILLLPVCNGRTLYREKRESFLA